MSDSTSDPKLAALEKSLTALVPVPGRIDRDQLLFRAGQASVRTRPWLWPTSTALLAVVASVLGTALVMRPAPTTVDRVVYVPVPQPAGMSPAPRHQVVVSPSSPGTLSSVGDTENLWASSAEYLQQRNQAIRWGVDALPQPPSAASSMQTTVESMLGLPEKKAERAEQFHLKF
jgi:hypothetical protein